MWRPGAIVKRIQAIRRKDQADAQLDEELRFHLEMETRENLRRGMSPEEARYAAMRSFGGVEQVKEAYRSGLGWPWIEGWIQDLRFAVRSLMRRPRFMIVAALSLGLGIGANTAVASLFSTLVFRFLPFPEQDRVVLLYSTSTTSWGKGRGSNSVGNLEDLRRRNTVFAAMGAFQNTGANLEGEDHTIRLDCARVEPDIFDVLQVKPALGSLLLPGESREHSNRVALISHSLWVERFGADRKLVGKEVKIDGQAHVVVGVMPESFQFPPRSHTALWLPLTFTPRQVEERGSHWLNVIARLRPEVSGLDAQLEMNRIAKDLEKEYPDVNASRGVELVGFVGHTAQQMTRILLVLWIAVTAILLLASVNVAQMVLARSAARRRELAVRIAMGAGRWRVVRMLVLEALVLGLAGCIVGIAAARWSLDLLAAAPEYPLPADEAVVIDARMMVYCLGVSMLAALLAGLWPAIRASRLNLQTSLKEGEWTFSGPRGWRRSALLIAELGLCLMLVAGTLLLTRSLRELSDLNLGFRPENVVTMKVALPLGYEAADRSNPFFMKLTERVRALPGVRAAGVVNLLPVQSAWTNMAITIEGKPITGPHDTPMFEHRLITPGYFEALGVPLVAGRYFTDRDFSNQSPAVVMINQEAARRYFPGENPLGRRIVCGTKPKVWKWHTIVGIVGNVKNAGVYRSWLPVLYAPVSTFDWPQQVMSLVVKSSDDTGAIVGSIRHELGNLEPGAAVFLVKPMQKVVDDSTQGTRFLWRLLIIFSLLAAGLAVAGVYGVASYAVARRTHEIGVRMAMGAERWRVLRMVLGFILKQALIGVALGCVWGMSLNRVMQAYVIGIDSVHVPTYLFASALVVMAALTAGLIPALRAARLDPLGALREE